MKTLILFISLLGLVTVLNLAASTQLKTDSTKPKNIYEKVINFFKKQDSPELIAAYLEPIDIEYEEYADSNKSDKENNKNFYKMYQTRRIALLDPIINKGVKVDSMVNNYTLFEDAVLNSNFILADYLLTKGAILNRKIDKNGNTFFIKCICWQDLAAIKYLIQKGVNINQSNDEKETALIIATMRTAPDTPILPAIPMYTDILTESELTPGFQITRDPYQEYLQKLNDYQSMQDKTKWLINKHEKSKKWTMLPIVKYLIQHGANINDQDNTGWTALDYAQTNDQPEVTEYLKSKGGVAMRYIEQEPSFLELLFNARNELAL